LRIKIFADTASINQMIELNKNPLVAGYTCNPTLMAKAGVKNYKDFIAQAVKNIPDKPLSFEVVSDDFSEMYEQAKTISSFGSNIYVKIPITDTNGSNSYSLIDKLLSDNILVNVTAVFTIEQIKNVIGVIGNRPSIISIFAGRISDAGYDANWFIRQAALLKVQKQELLWASTRELHSIIDAEINGCDIITITPDLIKKMNLLGKDLNEFSRETVQMFYDDAVASGLTL
jgi:transaldolase